MTDEELEKKLFEVSPKDSKGEYTGYLIDQYKLYIQSAERISDRRLETNKFFLTLNTAVIGAFVFIEVKFSGELTFLVLLGAAAGSVISYYWLRMIESYKGLNTGKFRVIHAIEKRLPLSLYDTEWEALGRGEDSKKYRPFTHIEVKVPLLFILIYVILFVISIPWATLFAILQNLSDPLVSMF